VFLGIADHGIWTYDPGIHMTRQEYISKTGIKDASEAAAYLNKTKNLFISVFFGIILFRAIDLTADEFLSVELYYLIWVAYLGFYIYFIAHCYKIIKLTKKVTKANIAWSLLFAPLSWAWFYPELTKPLKVIAGDMDPPDEKAELVNLETEKKIAKGVGRTVIYCAIATTVLLALLFPVFYFLDLSYTPDTSGYPSSWSQTLDRVTRKITFSENDYSIVFPSTPTSTSGFLDEAGSSTIKVISTGIGSSFFVLRIYDFKSETINERNKAFDLNGLYETELSDMVKRIDGLKLIRQFPATLKGRTLSRVYKFEVDQTFIEGFLTFYRGKLYNVLTEYDKQAVTPMTSKAFLESFELNEQVSE
jgi:hypothetical protein